MLQTWLHLRETSPKKIYASPYFDPNFNQRVSKCCKLRDIII